jgi:hypothetical protein
MNILKTALIAGLFCVSLPCLAADPLTPTQEKAAKLEAEAKAAQIEVAQEQALEKARRKAEWASKTWSEAMAIRGQACVDYSQWGVGRAAEYSSYADGKVVEYVIVLPGQFIQGCFTTTEAGAKDLADGAFNNAPKQVAVKAPETK